jgi:hypothetical protein
MSDYGDDDLRRDDGEDRLQWLDEARRRVQTPGLLLQVFGIISLILAVAYLALVFAAPDVVMKGQYDFAVKWQKDQPQAKPLPPYEEFVKSQQIQNGAYYAFAAVCSVLIFLGASKMKQLQGYGLAITSSVMATIPICTNTCCCLATPFGIWALVVLLNSDVKLAFTRVKSEAAGGAS